MYTVVRFHGLDSANVREELLACIRNVRPNRQDDPAIGRDHLAVSVSHGDSWSEQLSGILAFCQDFKDVLEFADRSKVRVELDCAVYHDDVKGLFISVTFPPDVARAVADANISLTLTWYPKRE
jgi:hypothetical protein